MAVGAITTMTALTALPWSLKALWAPVIDARSRNRGSLRRWIGCSLLAMGGLLSPAALLDPGGQTGLLSLFLLLHALAASTHDAAVDGLALASTRPGERGLVNGVMQLGMLAGRGLCGGGAILFAAWWGIPATILAVATLLVLSGLLVLGLRRVIDPMVSPAAGHPPIGGVLREVLLDRRTWPAALFAASGGAVFEGIGAVGGVYFVDLGIPPGTIGLFFGLVAVAAMATGALAGGVVADRWGSVRSTARALLILVATGFALSAADFAPAPSRTVLPLLLFTILYTGIGLFTASSYALFMDRADPRVAATMFSGFMGLTNLCEFWSGSAAGRIAEHFGYAAAFFALALVSACSALLLVPLGRRTPAAAGSP